MTKVCGKCGLIKPTSEFSRRDGRPKPWCKACTTARQWEYTHGTPYPGPQTLQCAQCGITFTSKPDHLRRFCTRRCGRLFRRFHDKDKMRKWYREYHRRNDYRWPYLGKNQLAIRYASCILCRNVLTLHKKRTLCRRSECQEIMRQHHNWKDQIDYWRIADTPQAQQVVETFVELRNTLKEKSW